MGILDHIGFAVTDIARSRAFYEQALAPLGIKLLLEVTAEQTGNEAQCGFGRDHPEFWIGTGGHLHGALHVAFTAPRRAVVDAFTKAELAAAEGRERSVEGKRVDGREDQRGRRDKK